MAIQREPHSAIVGMGEIPNERVVRSSETERIFDEIKGREKEDKSLSSLDEKNYSYQRMVELDPSLEFEEEMDKLKRGVDEQGNTLKKEGTSSGITKDLLERETSHNKEQFVIKDKKEEKKDKKKQIDPLLKKNEDDLITLSAGNSLHSAQSAGREIDTNMDNLDSYETFSDFHNRESAGEETVFDIYMIETSKDALDGLELKDDTYKCTPAKEFAPEPEHFDYPSIGDEVFSNDKELTNKYWSN